MAEVSQDHPVPRQLERPSRVSWASDPIDTSLDRWLSFARYTPIVVPVGSSMPSAATEHALGRAKELTERARVVAADLILIKAMQAAPRNEQEREIATYPFILNGWKPAPLHQRAAELRREAGAWELCIENYTALIRDFLEQKNLKAAAAYTSKLMFVTERSSDPAARLEACFLAAKVHIAFRQTAPASVAASEAAHIAARSSDRSAQDRADELFRTIAKLSAERPVKNLTSRCACDGGRSYIECCGMVVNEVPAEFQVQLSGIETDAKQPQANPWHTLGRSGLDVLMERPGQGGECLDWVSLRVAGGRHRLVTLPNWSSRAMRAARTMVKVSLADPDGTDGPSSTVLQVACALEAFVNAIHFFLSRSQSEGLAYRRLPENLFGVGFGATQLGNAHTRLSAMGTALFGNRWGKGENDDEQIETSRLLADLELLCELRNTLNHFKGENEEQIIPIPSNDHPMVQAFGSLKILRDAPGPWIDRVLTPGLAQWSVDLGDKIINQFRADWVRREEARSMAGCWISVTKIYSLDRGCGRGNESDGPNAVRRLHVRRRNRF